MSDKVVLKIEHLKKRYGDLQAVDDLSIEIYEGEIFGFLGPNGAGKSTSINMMCGLLKPDDGNIYIRGKKVNGGDRHLRSIVGMCPQGLILWTKLSCREQLLHIGEMYGVPAKIVKERADRLLRDMGLESKRNKLAGTLSGGMQRRLNLIMALMHDPEIIVLDEPEAGLDPQSKVMVREYIRSLSEIKTVILTTHNMDEAERVCDRVAIIDHGKLLELDTIEKLKHKNRSANVLELEVEETGMIEITKQIISPFASDITVFGNLFVISHQDILERLSDILKELKINGIKITEIRIRENSLEDIFINLTGRRLRE
jgi:ABC-2 type transport system ATP-binding protein